MVIDSFSVTIDHLYQMAPENQIVTHLFDDVKWSRDEKRHLTLTGRGRDTNMLGPIT